MGYCHSSLLLSSSYPSRSLFLLLTPPFLPSRERKSENKKKKSRLILVENERISWRLTSCGIILKINPTRKWKYDGDGFFSLFFCGDDELLTGKCASKNGRSDFIFKGLSQGGSCYKIISGTEYRLIRR